MENKKKKFKDTVVGKLLLGVAATVNPTLGKVLEGVTDPKAQKLICQLKIK